MSEELPDKSVFDFSAPTENVNFNIKASPPSLDVETLSVTGTCTIQTTRSRNPSLQLVIPDPQKEEYKQLKEIQKGMDHLKINTIHNLPWPIKSGIENLFEKKKDDKNDWRTLAYRLGLTSTFIEEMEENPPKHPCRKVFDEKSNVKVNKLIQELYQMERWDVIEFIYADMNKLIPKKSQSEKQHEFKLSSSHPSQETTPESSSSVSDCQNMFIPQSQETTPKSPQTPRTPKSAESEQLKKHNSFDSGKGSSNGRMRSESNPKQHSDATAYPNDDHKTKLDFHDKESKSFWESIPPNAHSTRKEWKNFEEKLKSLFPKVCQQSQLLRLICYILKVEYDQRNTHFVSDQDFANMIAWFGPLNKDGCLQKMSKLIEGSVSYNHTNTGGHSFFAGYMSKDDSDKAVMAGEIGTFLIRFSTTYAQEGKFVLVLKTEVGPEHHIIEQQGNGLTFDQKTYPDLIQLYKGRLRKGGVSQDKRTSCRHPCPNLPLNAMFRSYGKGPKASSTGTGRGRGRGKQLNQSM